MTNDLSSGLDAAVMSLTEEDKRLAEREKGLAQELATVKSDRSRIGAALKALGKRPAASSDKAKKPAPNNQQVIAVIEEVLLDRGILEESDLRQAVEEVLSNTGNSRIGFSLRFKQAIKDKRFIDSPAGYKLASSDDESGDVTAKKETKAV